MTIISTAEAYKNEIRIDDHTTWTQNVLNNR